MISQFPFTSWPGLVSSYSCRVLIRRECSRRQYVLSVNGQSCSQCKTSRATGAVSASNILSGTRFVVWVRSHLLKATPGQFSHCRQIEHSMISLGFVRSWLGYTITRVYGRKPIGRGSSKYGCFDLLKWRYYFSRHWLKTGIKSLSDRTRLKYF
jgi:hypothetical protein